jgi:uncharacterized phiE125 gp8 family phage protein
MRVLVITPPEPVVSLSDAKQHLGVLHDDEDALITAMVAAATQHLDAEVGWLGRAISPRELEARGVYFDGCRIRPPFPPVISVSSIKYLDTNGAEQALATDQYEVRGNEIVRAWGVSWPSVRRDDENVRIRYWAGYAADPAADPLIADVPAPIVAAIKLMVGDLYFNRETTISGTIVQSVPMSTTVENLLAPFRVFA